MEIGEYKELTEVPKKILPDLITASKAAGMRGVTVFSIWHHVRENRLNFYTVAGVRFLLRSEVENFTKLKPGVKPKAEGKRMNEKQNEIEVELNVTETTTEDLKWNKFREQLFRPLDEPEFPTPTFLTSRDEETGKFKTRRIFESTADDSLLPE